MTDLSPLPRPEPVVLIPGFMADARAFMPQLIDLGVNRPVVVVTPAMGDTLDRLTAEVVARLPARFALVGHGLGGNLAIEILRKVPHAVTRIALIATDPLPEPFQVAAEQETLLVALKTGQMASCMSRMLPASALYPSPWREEVMALVQDMAATLGPDQFRRQLRMLERRPDQQKTLRRADVPTLILAGEADTLVPRRRAEFLAAMMPHGCVEVIAEAGHMPQLEQPQAVTAALETFLSGRLPTLLLS